MSPPHAEAWENQALLEAKVDHLYRLAKLLEQGILTQAEFATEKRKILAGAPQEIISNIDAAERAAASSQGMNWPTDHYSAPAESGAKQRRLAAQFSEAHSVAAEDSDATKAKGAAAKGRHIRRWRAVLAVVAQRQGAVGRSARPAKPQKRRAQQE